MPDPTSDWTEVTIYDPREIIPSIIPGARVKSTSRPPEHPLSRKNPRSLHINNPNAFDMAPIPGMTYAEFRDKMQEQGYTISNPIDEVAHPSKWATGPHWHGVITGGPAKDPVPLPGQSLPAEPIPTSPNAAPAKPLYTEEQLAQMEKDQGGQLAEEQQRDLYRGLGPKRGGNFAERVWGALQEPGLPEGYQYNPMALGIDQLLRVMNAGTEAIKGTPLEGVAMASPLGGAEVGGAAALGRVAGALSPAETTLIQRFVKAQRPVEEVNAALKEAGSSQQVTPETFEAAKTYARENPDWTPEVVPEAPKNTPPKAANEGYAPDSELTDPDLGVNDTLRYEDGRPVSDIRVYTEDELRQLAARRAGQEPLAQETPLDNSNVTSLHSKRVKEAEDLLKDPNPDLNKVQDAIDYLDEAYSQGRDVGALQDRLMELELKLQNPGPKNPPPPAANSDTRLSPKDITDNPLEQDLINKSDIASDLGFNDERRWADRRSKAYKEWDAETSRAEQARDEAAKKFYESMSDEDLAAQIERSKRFGQLDRIAEDVLAQRRLESPQEPVQSVEQAPATQVANEAPTASTPPPGASGGEPPVPPKEPVVTRLQKALRTAGKATEEQARLYKEERARRFAQLKNIQDPTKGEEVYAESLAALKGELPKADFEGVRNQFTQDDVDELFQNITKTPTLTETGKVSAYSGLTNILQGKVPQPKQLEYLRETFPEDFIQEVLKKRSRVAKSFGNIGEVWHLPKTMMSSLDLSALLRQGIGLSHRGEYWKSVASMFKYAVSQRGFDDLAYSIKTHPNYATAEDAGLALTNVGGKGASEEAFQSHLGEKIPGIKHLVRGSERAYVGFLDKLRFDTFNSMLDEGRLAGIDFEADPDAAKGVANFINVMTGRGGLGKLEPAANALNAVFFSPRLISSRLQMLTAPVQGLAGKGMIAEIPKGLRVEAAKSYAAMVGGYASAIGLATLAGYEVVSDPRSSDFGKLKDGNTRVDLGAGLLQYITAGARAITRQSTAVGNQKTRELTKRGDTPLDTDLKFIMNKMNPSLSLIFDQQRGTNAVGEPFQGGFPKMGTELEKGNILNAGEIALKNALIQRLTPMGIPDIVETLKEHPDQKGVLYATLGLLGAGLQNFDASRKPGTPKRVAPSNAPLQSVPEGFEGPAAIPGTVTKLPEGFEEVPTK